MLAPLLGWRKRRKALPTPRAPGRPHLGSGAKFPIPVRYFGREGQYSIINRRWWSSVVERAAF